MGTGDLRWNSTPGNARLNYDGADTDLTDNIVFGGPASLNRQFEFSLDDSQNNSTFNDSVATSRCRAL